jgi:xanthine dehydrogenase accessory factor
MTTSPFAWMVELAATGREFAVATVVRTHGSTPQVVGARLIVTDDEAERPFGTLGGGCVEADAILAAREVLHRGGRSLREYRLTEDLAWNTGLVCGGTMWILAERGADACAWTDDGTALEALSEAARGGRPLAIVTRLAHERRGYQFAGRMAVCADGGLIGSLGDAASDARLAAAVQADFARPPHAVMIDDDYDAIVEPVTTRPRLVIAGGGHVAKAIARQAQLLDFDVTVLEDRPDFADPARFDGAAVIAGDIAGSIAAFDYSPDTFLVIATRGHKLDGDCVLAAANTGARYIGLLGSRRKTVLITAMLKDAGVEDARLGAMHAPVGLDLGGRTPGEIALSVLAEITQVRYGGSGHPLRNAPAGRADS